MELLGYYEVCQQQRISVIVFGNFDGGVGNFGRGWWLVRGWETEFCF
jgi:hypothetical protein